jgi:hypothetical protein
LASEALASERINVVNDSIIDLDQTDEEAFTDEISDEALEVAASGALEGMTFTISVVMFYCQFC